MISKNVLSILALSAVVSAVPAMRARQNDSKTTESCTPLPSSTKAADPIPTSIPGGCNPAHPGSCPTPSTTKAVDPIPTSIPGGCNPAHPGSCPTPSTTKAADPIPTSIPGGCNPAHPGSCPTPSAAVPSSGAGSGLTKVPNKTWTINNLTRYCGEGNTGCDYNFTIDINGKHEQCTIIRQPGSNAASESWYSQPCNEASRTFFSWGFSANPSPAYAVITINNGKEIAWAGVSDVNGQKVTPSNPFGSGQFTVAPAQVFA